MAHAVRNGNRVVCVTATRGEAADPERWPPAELAQIREAEIAHALEILGVTRSPLARLPGRRLRRCRRRGSGRAHRRDDRRSAARHRADLRARRWHRPPRSHRGQRLDRSWRSCARRTDARALLLDQQRSSGPTASSKRPIDMGVMMGAESLPRTPSRGPGDLRSTSTASSSTSRSGPCARRRRRCDELRDAMGHELYREILREEAFRRP